MVKNIEGGFIIIYILLLVPVAVIWYMIMGGGTPKKNYDERMKYLQNKVESLGGKVTNITKVKKGNCPFNNEANDEDGSMHVFYKVDYMLEDENKEGWAILKMQPSLLTMNNAGMHEAKWILKL